ncbi:MAG: hypothetical protein ACFFAN_02985 [Promethearchaeota archaeon]
MRDRYCFECGQSLNWWSFVKENFHLSQDYLKKLWKNRKLQFFCCKCFKKENDLRKYLTNENKLNESKSERIYMK